MTTVVIASWLPVLVGATTRPLLGWLAVVPLALAIGWLTRPFTAGVLAAGLLVSSALVPSGLVTDATHYMPVAVTAGALLLRVALDARHGRLSNVVPPSVLLAVGLYLAWAAIATAASTDHRLSAVYLVGMVVVCGLAFWAVPAMLGERLGRERLLATLGVLGVIVALSVYLVSFFRDVRVFGRPIGDYQLADLTIRGHATGVLFGRSAGIDLAPLEASVLIVVGVIAMLGWSSTRSGRELLLGRLAIVVMVPAVVLTLDRTAWLAAIVSAGVFAALAASARVHALTGAVVCLLFASLFLFVLVGEIGANAVGNACTADCSASGSDESTLRGGTGLSGREILWRASISAIEKRPILGYGPGTDVPAIAPYLGESRALTQNLTSHSTWLRTAVEMGVPGLVFLLGVIAAVAWLFIRNSKTALADPVYITLAATVCGLLAAMTFETFLLGGVTFTSLYLALALGLMVAPLRPASASAPAARRAPVGASASRRPGSVEAGP